MKPVAESHLQGKEAQEGVSGMRSYQATTFRRTSITRPSYATWLLKREELPFNDAHGKEAFNFPFSETIFAIIYAILSVIVIGFALLVILILFALIFMIIASVLANSGSEYRYQMAI